jgi:hypothetical protein
VRALRSRALSGDLHYATKHCPQRISRTTNPGPGVDIAIGRAETRPGHAETPPGAGRDAPGAGRDAPGPGRAYRGEPLGSVEAQAPSEFVLVHDRVGVAVRDAGVVGQPVRAFVAAQERRARFEAVEPLSEVTSGNDRDACNEAIVQIR